MEQQQLVDLWRHVLASVKARWGTGAYEPWLDETRPRSLQDGILIVECPDELARDWFLFRYHGEVSEILSRLTGRQFDLRPVVGSDSRPPQPRRNGHTRRVHAEAAPATGQANRPARGPRQAPPSPSAGETARLAAPTAELPPPAEAGLAAAGASPTQPALPAAERGDGRGTTRTATLRTATRRPGLGEVTGAPLNPRYTFDNFVVGKSNELAHAAALAVSMEPAKTYNPLFIYGGVGLGKTHLMHAIGHCVREEHPNLRVVYVSSETFTNDLINAITDQATLEFRNKYRSVDILLIDDIQFVAGKERTQEEFFHTFNALYEANKQIVISSDRPPHEIHQLEERLRSRFTWGLMADIQPPDLETRVAILRKKATREGLEIPNEALLYIARHIQSNIRELEGALTCLQHHLTLHRVSEVTVDVVAQALRGMIGPTRTRPITIELIQQVVASHYGLKVPDMKSKKRTRTVAYPRQIAMYLARELTDASLPTIGEEFGGRDHSTVIHGCERVKADCQQDPALAATLQELIEKIQRAAGG